MPTLAAQLERAAALLAAPRPGPYSTPSTRTEPALGSSSRLIVRSSVDLPEPDGPEDDDVLARVHGQVDAVQHLVRAERLLDAFEPHDHVAADVRRACPGGDADGPGLRHRRRDCPHSGRTSG